MSSHPAGSEHRELDPSTQDSAARHNPGLGRSHSDAAVAITLGLGIGVLAFLLVLPYLGRI
ncbi:hypothetical protein [Nesterenkonia jeotgali]|uniref:Uncharacterized protein n=1 Tax=Nesterenkonia jeotgali TaxID=317018 RepID=A0A839FK99_9MICC|nr:hypothetical protein [Nesterenkonia jeotgali]MBA8922120.1 hypothetical protein [Nesterenkonia jeotgali]